MKRRAAAVGLSVFLLSCSGSPNPFGDLVPVMSAKVDGASFLAWVPPDRSLGDLGYYHPLGSSDSVLDARVAGSAFNPTNTLSYQMYLGLTPFHGVGRYSLCDPIHYPDSSSALYAVASPGDTSVHAKAWISGGAPCSGLAVVQSFDPLHHTIVGTFQFTGVNWADSSAVAITAGTFNGTYLPQAP